MKILQILPELNSGGEQKAQFYENIYGFCLNRCIGMGLAWVLSLRNKSCVIQKSKINRQVLLDPKYPK
jgi:hypothetical protein